MTPGTLKAGSCLIQYVKRLASWVRRLSAQSEFIAGAFTDAFWRTLRSNKNVCTLLIATLTLWANHEHKKALSERLQRAVSIFLRCQTKIIYVWAPGAGLFVRGVGRVSPNSLSEGGCFLRKCQPRTNLQRKPWHRRKSFGPPQQGVS